jgi:hypothetical protein
VPFIDPAMFDMTRLFAAVDPPRPSRPKTEVRPVRVYIPDRELHTTVVRGRGFRAVASDGWKGPERKTYADAREDKRAHEREHG